MLIFPLDVVVLFFEHFQLGGGFLHGGLLLFIRADVGLYLTELVDFPLKFDNLLLRLLERRGKAAVQTGVQLEQQLIFSSGRHTDGSFPLQAITAPICFASVP